MRVVSDMRVAEMVAGACKVRFAPPLSCIGIEKDGEVIGGVVFNCFEGTDIHATVAGKGWSPEFLRIVGKYIFGTLGCERVTAKTEQASVVRIAQKLGGQVEGELRNHFGPGRNATIIGILRDEYRFKE